MHTGRFGSARPLTAPCPRPPRLSHLLQDAAIIANAVVLQVVAALAPGASIADLCEMGDAAIDAELAKVYKKAKLVKGIAFPTCISVNECIGHYSPFKTESKVLVAGDMVKVCVPHTVPPTSRVCAPRPQPPGAPSFVQRAARRSGVAPTR